MSDIAYRELGESMGESAIEAPKKYYPSVSLDLSDFPELKELDISDEITLSFKCQIRSRHESESDSSVCLDLLSGGVTEVTKAPAISAKDVAAVKNNADTALEAITNLKRSL